MNLKSTTTNLIYYDEYSSKNYLRTLRISNRSRDKLILEIIQLACYSRYLYRDNLTYFNERSRALLLNLTFLSALDIGLKW